MKLGLTEDDARAASRAQIKGNRELWKALGFRMFTTQVHDEERELVLAELEVRKFQRMAMLAEDKATTANELYTIATRNMYKLPTSDMKKDAAAKAENSRAKKEVLHFLEQSRHYSRKHHAVRSKYDHDAEYTVKVRLEAKNVVYGNLSAAYYKLAVVRLDHAGRTTIFGLRGEDTPLPGEFED